MSDKINDGGPAFPNSADMYQTNGMSLRDYFAAVALQGLISATQSPPEDCSREQLVEAFSRGAYHIADAMLRERNK